jgi:hypothetical protein
MKVFVSYAFTGEDFDTLRQRLSGLRDLFGEMGLDYYINTFASDWQAMMDRGATGGEFLDFALEDMKTSDLVLVLNSSERRSEGMLMEIGAAVAMNKKILLAQHQSSIGKTYTNTVADETFVWSSESELLEKVRQVIQKINHA